MAARFCQPTHDKTRGSRLKRILRDQIKRHLPEVDAILHARALRRHFGEAFTERQRAAKARLYGVKPPVVLGGPFAGMAYLDEIVWGPIESKWLGCYEAELHDVIETIVRTPYAAIIDVGSAEGYYAVGLARRMPKTPVFSFDIDPWGRAQQRRLARLNSVTNITFGRFCRAADIERLARGRTLVICDIEGHEYRFLDPGQAPRLTACDILVELHPDEHGNLSAAQGADLLATRFAHTHEVRRIDTQPRVFADAPAGLGPAQLRIYADEMRDFPQCWLWMTAKASLERA